jgi:polyhydroxybutyrate depolymerase
MMLRVKRHSALASLLTCFALAFAATARAEAPGAPPTSHPTTQPATHRWTMDGVERIASVYVPARAAGAGRVPLVFAFHGHGGTSAGYAAKVRLHDAWPEALVVYPQGLNTPGRLTDRAGKFPGWQAAPGEQQDRDLKFFDAMLESLSKDFPVDPDRVYITGHSNGGSFTYVLWQTARRERIAAFAPAASALSVLVKNPDDLAADAEKLKLPPRPVLHIAGRNDPLVKFEWQERTVTLLRRLNHTAGPGEAWAANCTRYPPEAPDRGAAVIAWFHHGKHALPPRAGEVIVKFFKEYPRPAKTAAKP